MTLTEYYYDKGRSSVSGKLRAAEQALYSRIKDEKTKQDVRTLSQNLTQLFYPEKDDTSGQQQLNEINELIRQSFMTQHNEKLEEGFNIISRRWARKEGLYLPETQPKVRFDQKTALREKVSHMLNTIKNFMNRMTGGDLKTLQAYFDQFNQLEGLATQARDLVGELEQFLFGKKGDGKRINLITKKDNMSEIYGKLQAFYIIISGEALSSTEMGDVWEYALAFLNNDMSAVVDAEIKDLMEQVRLQTIGSKNAARKSSLDVSAYIEDIAMEDAGLFLTQGETNTTYKFGDMTITRAVSLNPDSEKYGKIDVIKEEADLRISAKNWSSLWYNDRKNGATMRSLGEAKLLDTLARANRTSVVSEYLYALQDDKTKAHMSQLIAHKVAEISILTDIAMGFGNDNAANVLVINDKSKRQVLVIDMAAEVAKAAASNRFGESRFLIKDYSKDEIQNTTKKVSALVRSRDGGNPYKGKRQQIFSTVMYDYLASKKVAVVLNRNKF